MKIDDLLTAVLEADKGPSQGDLLNAPLLNPWRIDIWDGHFRLYGACTGHPEIDDPFVTTSPLLALDPDRGWARTRSRWYRVGSDWQPTNSTPKGETLRTLAAWRKALRSALAPT